uniref:YTH domain-containing protein n=1 Tax=Anopheles culicifacies TaxID=139723 RepID=A0A182MMK8_9DIPT
MAATAEIDNQSETQLRNSVNEPEPVADERKTSELSQSFETKLSTIIEEDDTKEAISLPARFEKLARPKVQHLEETLKRIENSNKKEMNERIAKIKTRLYELRGSDTHVSHVQTDKKSNKPSEKSEAIYNNLQSSLRKVAFEMLVKQIFDKMPELIVKMQQTRAQTMPPEMKTLLDTLQATLIYYLGQPTNEHEERVFNHLSFGLAKFIENVIENVHTNQQHSERDGQLDGKLSDGHYPVAVQLARKAYKERQ